MRGVSPPAARGSGVRKPGRAWVLGVGAAVVSVLLVVVAPRHLLAWDTAGARVADRAKAINDLRTTLLQGSADRDLESIRHAGACPACERNTDRYRRRSQPLGPSPEPASESGYLLGEGLAWAGILHADESPHPQ